MLGHSVDLNLDAPGASVNLANPLVCEIIAEFHMMTRRKIAADLTSCIERTRNSLVASFGNGVVKDEAAVRVAITLPWSNEQTEGQIARLKLVRRQMCGRGNIDLLQARLIGAE